MSEPADGDGLVRLQKLLASSGVASRRRCEELMPDGRVEVDGEVVTRLGTKVDPRTAVIRVDGDRLPPVTEHVYLALHKPRGVVSTMSDPEGRRSLADLVADRPERLFHVGRLDTDSVSIDQTEADRSMLTLTLHEGRNRIVRRMFDAVGHPVRRLTRTSVGPVRLAGLRSGQIRELTRAELGPLLDTAGL